MCSFAQSLASLALTIADHCILSWGICLAVVFGGNADNARAAGAPLVDDPDQAGNFLSSSVPL
jgi:hypothetical protein